MGESTNESKGVVILTIGTQTFVLPESEANSIIGNPDEIQALRDN